MTVPVAADRLRIDLKHPVPSRSQPRHEQASAGFYRDIHRDELALTGVPAQQRHQRRQPRGVIADPLGRQHPGPVINQRDLVIAL
jgi:hypothetical protein